MNLQRVKKRTWIIITTIWTRNDNSLQKEQNTIIGKQYAIDMFDEGKSNMPQYHIPIYDGWMWQYSRCRRGR